jgi:hypothetical protein
MTKAHWPKKFYERTCGTYCAASGAVHLSTATHNRRDRTVNIARHLLTLLLGCAVWTNRPYLTGSWQPPRGAEAHRL